MAHSPRYLANQDDDNAILAVAIRDWGTFLRDLDVSERAWNDRKVRYPREDCVPWLPYPIPQFISLLTEAVMVAPARTVSADFLPTRFCDVGAGTGTKIRLAEALFGLDGYGVEIVPELAQEARSRGQRVDLADAFTWERYDEADIVYVNRPSTFMAELEHVVMDGMRPGAVLMMVNGRGDPGSQGWALVTREWGEPVAGCWIKP